MSTRIIAIANQKGGVGKTTTAINLCACLVERRKKVLLIDLDPQANATSGLGLEKTPGGSVYRVLLGAGDLQSLIKPTAYKRFDVIPSELDLAGAEVDIVMASDYLSRLKKAMEPLLAATDYDFIFIDCPPSLGVLSVNALACAHGVLIPLQCEYYALEGLSTITGVIEELRTNGANPELEIDGIVMTMYSGRTRLAQQVVQEVVDHFPTKIYEALIPRNVRLSEAPSFGKPVIVYDKSSVGAMAYRLLAREFIQRHTPASPAAPAEPVAAAEAPTVVDEPAPAEPAAAAAESASAPEAATPPVPQTSEVAVVKMENGT